MRISILIPNRDSPVVDRAVAGALAQTEPGDEVVVAGSDAPHRLDGVPGVVLVPVEGALPGRARNAAAAHATGDVFAFLDADCEPAPGWLATHRRVQSEGYGVVCGGVVWDRRPYWRMVDNLSNFHTVHAGWPPGSRRHTPALNLTIARHVWTRVGPMDPSLPRGEDIDWTLRSTALGWPVRFEPRAWVQHLPPGRSGRAEVLARWRTAGAWMADVRRRRRRHYPGTDLMLAYWFLTLAWPFIAAVATLGAYKPGAPGWRYPEALPGVLATKAAWCFGALSPMVVGAAPTPVPGDPA